MSQGGDMGIVFRFLKAAWRRRWWLVGGQVAITAAILSFYWILPREYKSSTIISVERAKVINPLVKMGPGTVDEMSERLRTLEQEIRSRNHLEKVITRLGLEKTGTDPLTHEELVLDMMKNTLLEIYKTNSFKISFIGKDPYKVRDITNVLAGIFIEDSLASKEGEVDISYKFLQEQLEVYRRKLEDSEIALRQFEEKHLEELPSSQNANQARLDSLLVSLGDTRQNIHQVQAQREMLIRKITEGSPEEKKGPVREVPNPLQAVLAEKEEQLRQLSREFSDKYPDVIRLRSEVENLRLEVAKRPTVPASEVPRTMSAAAQQPLVDQIQKLDLDMEALKARQAQLEAEIARYQKRTQTAPQVDQEMTRLRRDYDVNSDIYDMFLRKAEEIRVSKELEASNKREIFRILDPAVLPLIPYKPQRLQIALMGIAAGLIVNLALIYLLVIRDSSFQGSEDLREYLGLDVLAGVPWAKETRGGIMPWLQTLLLAAVGAAYALFMAAFIFWEPLKKLLGGVL